ncbi:MAG: nucleotidyltransferase domain-containing protein [Chitinivibrionales bacterium]|nr:nucleotidyltransferase domain-containing protein [Chitinivibrionales bacterium]
MISKSDKDTIISLSKKYGLSKVLLFGSNASTEKEGRDIDIAVEGITPSKFFAFYGDLMLQLSKPVDVIDLSVSSRFQKMVAAEGIPIYG